MARFLSAWVRSYLQTRRLWWSHVWLAGRDSSLSKTCMWPHAHPCFPIFLFRSSPSAAHALDPSSIIFAPTYLSLHLLCFGFVLIHATHDGVRRWCNAGLRSWMFEQKFYTLFQSCEEPVWKGDWLSIFLKSKCVYVVCASTPVKKKNLL